jgi:hypothetical protein
MLPQHQVPLIPPEDMAPVSPVARTLSKSVHALAIEPLTMSLTVTGRKAYDVMLWIAQRSGPDADGWYAAPVSSILRGYGSSSKASERVQTYIQQMVKTAVVWRPLAESEQGSLLELEPGDPSKIPEDDEIRTFPLLAEARVSRRNGEAWVRWQYPPSIKEGLLNPPVWAQIDLNSIALLSTYTAVALYEICARFKNSPGGLTSRRPPEFWMAVLRESVNAKSREWRKIKNEFVLPAIEQINRCTEINIEIVEHRRGKSAESVQFTVERKPQRERVREPADLSLVVRAAKLDIREADFDQLNAKYGSFKVTEGMEALEAFVRDPSTPPVKNRAGYLKAILANRFPDDQELQLLPQEEAAGDKVARDGRSIASGASRDELVKSWLAHRYQQLTQEFAALPEAERDKWMDITAKRISTPQIRRRLESGDWKSPMVKNLVLDEFAMGTYAPGWKTPSDAVLAMHKLAEAPNA